MKKDNTITVFYDEVTQRDIYRLNGVDVTDTIEMLKDKWERQILDTSCRLFQLDMSIQQRLQYQLALTEKALELACEYIDCDDCPLSAKNCDSYVGEIDGCAKAISKCCLERAKEMMKSE